MAVSTSRVLGHLFVLILFYTCVIRSEDNSDKESEEEEPKYILRLVALYHETCQDASLDVAQITDLKISNIMTSKKPELLVSFAGRVTLDIESPLELDLFVALRIGKLLIPFPCVGGAGSCFYEDICSNETTSLCPAGLKDQGVECQCPIKKGEYSASNLRLELPSDLRPGKFFITANVTQGNDIILCQYIYANLDVIKFRDQE